MGNDDAYNDYEERRKLNVERNKNVLRELGLLRSDDKKDGLKTGHTCTRPRPGKNHEQDPRRSARLAALKHEEQSSTNDTGIEVKKPRWKAKHPKVSFREGLKQQAPGGVHKVRRRFENMDKGKKDREGYSTDSSSKSFYAVHVDLDEEGQTSKTAKCHDTRHVDKSNANSSSTMSLDSINTQFLTGFATQFQELVMRMLMQSTGALIGPPAAVQSVSQGGPVGTPILSTGGSAPVNTWTEALFNRCEATRKRKSKMTRTSAGEDSDSQKDYPAAENETPQQKALRIRRVNRNRARRSNELTSNRKAMNKLPYVIHIDGMGKARGIHKHQWRATIRGQCGRLDPSMDNINHHPKHVVDSIWHALEREWEFEGYAHRAREMFEKSATKFMRNRKMQLKYKCLKQKDGTKPNDINGTYWSKIEDLTRKSTKLVTSSVSRQTSDKGKGKRIEEDNDGLSPPTTQGTDDSHEVRSGSKGSKSKSILSEGENLDAKIRSLQLQLIKLQECKKVGNCIDDKRNSEDSDDDVEERDGQTGGRGLDTTKENRKPEDDNANSDMQACGTLVQQNVWSTYSPLENRSGNVKEALKETNDNAAVEGTEQMQMDCGDVARMFAVIGGKEVEVGKGILMGLGGSKFGRKVIPNGWCSIKLTAHTYNGSSEACPFPAGWTDMKLETLREANGKTIAWPSTLLRNLVL